MNTIEKEIKSLCDKFAVQQNQVRAITIFPDKIHFEIYLQPTQLNEPKTEVLTKIYSFSILNDI